MMSKGRTTLSGAWLTRQHPYCLAADASVATKAFDRQAFATFFKRPDRQSPQC